MKKRNVSKEIVNRLRDFTESLEASADAVCEKYTARKVHVDLRPQCYGATEVKAIRQKLGVSQAVFAKIMAVSPGTIKAWEQSVSEPSAIACRLMDQIAHDPERWIEWLKKKTTTTQS
jgi:putative transcriptional regulator